MNTHPITRHTSTRYRTALNDFEEALHDSGLLYSLRHLAFTGNISQERMLDTLQKSLQVCYLAGINSKQHFKKIYIFDANTETLYIDWIMSKKGFNLMVMQTSALNREMASWLWQLADL